MVPRCAVDIVVELTVDYYLLGACDTWLLPMMRGDIFDQVDCSVGTSGEVDVLDGLDKNFSLDRRVWCDTTGIYLAWYFYP